MEMSIDTPLTALLGIRHPILLAPMDLVSDARLTADHLRYVTQQRLAGAVHGTLPDQRSCASLDRPRTRTAAECGCGRRRICGGQGRWQFRCCGRDCRRSRWADP